MGTKIRFVVSLGLVVLTAVVCSSLFTAHSLSGEPSPTAQAPQDEELLGGRCGNWSGWQRVSTCCTSRFQCLRFAQKGTVEIQQRQRQCRNGIQTITRREFIGCGCATGAPSC